MVLKKGLKMKLIGSDVKVTETATGETTYLDRVMTPGIIEIIDPKEGTFYFFAKEDFDIFLDTAENIGVLKEKGPTIYKLDTEGSFAPPQTFDGCFGSLYTPIFI